MAECILCGNSSDEVPGASATPEAAALYRQEMGGDLNAELAKIGVCPTCEALPPLEKQRALRRALEATLAGIVR